MVRGEYYDDKIGQLDLLPSSGSLDEIKKICELKNLSIEDSLHDVLRLSEYANQDSMIILKRFILYTDNIYDSKDSLVKTISLKIKGKAVLFNDLCDEIMERVNYRPSCRMPKYKNKDRMICVRIIDKIKQLKSEDIERMKLSKSKLDFLDLMY